MWLRQDRESILHIYKLDSLDNAKLYLLSFCDSFELFEHILRYEEGLREPLKSGGCSLWGHVLQWACPCCMP